MEPPAEPADSLLERELVVADLGQRQLGADLVVGTTAPGRWGETAHEIDGAAFPVSSLSPGIEPERSTTSVKWSGGLQGAFVGLSPSRQWTELARLVKAQRIRQWSQLGCSLVPEIDCFRG